MPSLLFVAGCVHMVVCCWQQRLLVITCCMCAHTVAADATSVVGQIPGKMSVLRSVLGAYCCTALWGNISREAHIQLPVLSNAGCHPLTASAAAQYSTALLLARLLHNFLCSVCKAWKEAWFPFPALPLIVFFWVLLGVRARLPTSNTHSGQQAPIVICSHAHMVTLD